MTAILDRCGVFWEWLKNRVSREKKPRWANPAKNEEHQNYRRQYETLLPVLKGLPRGDDYEERRTYLFLAELLIGLHNYGDDPIMPPNLRRAVIREAGAKPATLGPARMGLLGGVAAANPIMGILTSTPALIAMAFAVPAIGGVIQTTRLNHAKHDLSDTRGRVASLERTLHDRTAERDLLAHTAQEADHQAHISAANLEAERAAHSRAAAIERRRQREIANVLTGRDPPAWSLRDAEPPATGAGDDHSAAGDTPGVPR